MIGLGSLFFNNVYTNFDNFNLIDSEFLVAWIKNIPFVFTVVGAVFSLLLINCYNVSKSYVLDLKLQPLPKTIYTFLNKKWHFDQIINELIVMNIMNFGYLFTFQTLDKGLIERLGPTGFTVSIYSSSLNFIKSNSGGLLYHGIFTILMFAITFFTCFVFISFGMVSLFSISFGFLMLSYLLVSLMNA
jgi:hypothetical protein